jgi:hypothetical protein
MSERCAVVGIGQTQHDAKRVDVSQVGLVREAAERALEDADLAWTDIDAVVVGKAPDMFEGVIMPELFLADALGAAGKPMLRVHTAGSVGGSTGIVAASLVEAGVHERVLCVAYEKQSESNAMWALTIAIPFQAAVVAGAGGYFAPLVRGYIARANPPEDTGIRVALKDRQAPGRLLRDDRELAHALGPDPLPGDVPLVGRGVRPGPGRRVCGEAHAAAAGLGACHGHAQRAHPVLGARPGESPGGQGLRGPSLQEGRDPEPASGDRLRRDLRSLQLVRAHVAPRTAKAGR